MKKPYLSMVLMLASAMTGFAATTEADFNAAQQAAIAKMASWSTASPYAPDAFSKGLANLVNTKYSAYPNGDAAVKAVDEILATTLSEAREELNKKVGTIFVTITTDALTARPVDGGNLVGTVYGYRYEDREFKTYNKVCQGSAWLFYQQCNDNAYHGMRNNVAYYIASQPVPDAEDEFFISPFNSYDYQPNMNVDFADNGKMEIRCAGKYIGTDEAGGLAYFDSFSPATSWTFTRAYDKKCDLPRRSTAEDPVWYVIRNASLPNDGYLASQFPDWKGLAIKPMGNNTMWRFDENAYGVENEWVSPVCKNGAYLLYLTSNHAISSDNRREGYDIMTFTVIDGYEDYGVMIWCGRESVCMNFQNATSYDAKKGCPYLLTKAPGGVDATFGNSYTIDIQWLRPDVFGDKSACWTFEEASDAGLFDFLNKRTQYANEVSAYASSQPWLHAEIQGAADMIKATEYDDYENSEAAIAAMRSMADQFLAALPGKLLAEASAGEKYFSISNGRRKDSGNTAGWMLSTDAAGKIVTTTATAPDAGATWQIEKVTDTTFRLKNREGYYLGSVRTGQAATTTKTASSAGSYSFALAGGRIVFSGTRSCLYLDDADGSLAAATAEDPGSRWILKNVTVLPENSLEVSDISDQLLYNIISVSEPLTYLEGIGDRYYNYARGYLNDGCYWFLDIPEDGEGYRFNSHRYASEGVRMCRQTDGVGNYGAPIDYFGSRVDGKYTLDYWYCIPLIYNDSLVYQISYCYPPEGNCCISRVMENGVMTYSSADDVENTAWYFRRVPKIDHEALFNQERYRLLPSLEAFLRVQPFAKELLEEARDYTASVKMTEFGPDSYSANPALTNYVSGIIEKAKWTLEDEPRGCAVYFKNVRRDGNNTAPYLAAVNGFANTVDLTDDTKASATWNLEYYNNGRYRLVNDNGEYLGPMSSSVEIVSDASQAGLYFIDFRNNYMTLADRNNPDNGLNVDQSGNNACVYGSDDAGSRWTIELVRLNGISAVSGDAADGVVEYYDLRGIRVNPADMAPGLYLERRGNRVSKILVK